MVHPSPRNDVVDLQPHRRAADSASSVGHWHFPWSRFTTSRFTLAGTQAFLFPCFSMSSPAPP